MMNGGDDVKEEKKETLAFTVRLDKALSKKVEEWMEANPEMSLNQVASMAIRKFVSEPQTLQTKIRDKAS